MRKTSARRQSGGSCRVPRRTLSWRTVLCLLITAGSLGVGAQAEDGTEDSPLLFGMSTALSGPAGDLGKNVLAGVEAAFAEVNAEGGVQGRKLELIALDDGYEPNQTVDNMRMLIEEKEVLAVVGNVGTPTAVAAIPIAMALETPFFGAYTGAGVLRRKPPDRYVINYRASYAEETGAMVDALINRMGVAPEKIAFFTQRDAYGDAGYNGGVTALKRFGVETDERVAHGRYERNTLAVENGLADILFHEPLPEAVIMVGAYGPCAKFIELAKTHQLDAVFLNVSFVGTAPLLQALGEASEGVVVTQVVPHYDADLPITAAYRDALNRAFPDVKPTFGSLEGYVVATILCRGIAAIEGPVTRESIVDGLLGLGEFDIGLGVPLTLGPGDHQASNTVWPTIYAQGEVRPFDWTRSEAGGEE